MEATIHLFNTDEPTSKGSHLIIPKEVAQVAVENFRKRLGKGEVYGCLEKEDDGPLRPELLSHKVNDIWIGDDGHVYMKIETLDTPRGKILTELLNKDVESFMPEMIAKVEERIEYEKLTELTISDGISPRFKK